MCFFAMEEKKENITDSLGIVNSWLFRGVGFFGVIFSGYKFFNTLLFSVTIQSIEFIIQTVFFLLFSFVTAKAIIDYSNIKHLSISSFGVHSKTKNVSWKDVDKIYLSRKFGIPILFFEVTSANNEEKNILKTTLWHLDGTPEKVYDKVMGRWKLNKNT